MINSISGFSTYKQSVNFQGNVSPALFKTMAEKMGISLERAHTLLSKAQAAGINTKKTENVEKILKGEFEYLYSYKFPKEKYGKGFGNLVTQFNHVNQRGLSKCRF